MTEQPPQLRRVRLRFERDFVQIPNAWMRDERLSFRARGILAALMTYQDGHRIYLKDLVANSPREGKDALNSAIDELEQIGYLVRTPVIGSSGIRVGYDWLIHDPFEPVDNPGSLGADEPLLGADDPLPTGADDPPPIRTLNNTPRSSSGGNHRGNGASVESPYRNRATETLSALAESRVFLAEVCQHVRAGSGRPCGGRILRDDPRWCQFGHRQGEAEQ